MTSNGTLPIAGGTLAAARAEAGRFAVSDLVFAGGTFLREHAHERACLAFVLAGTVDKRFASSTHLLRVSQTVTMPAAAIHSDRFPGTGARLLAIEPLGSDDDLGPCTLLFTRISVLSVPNPIGPAWRLTSELRASDPAAPLALEALVLDLVAASIRRLLPPPALPRRPPGWLAAVEERLHDWNRTAVRVAALADEIGVHPVHLARVFRAHHGVPLGTYLRGLRLDWAAGQLRTSTPLAEIAAGAGFVDQSHFTRAFRRHTGLTPGQYRASCGS
jgi:AraC family transcriptional regulator